ncbi:hypothetical protein [Candidatus Halobonum tyrrellensis]|uniref:Uncharacterized protein n=1 Tax=Candidatus Halobonum tyrrellensis G22 TaxID=1324957 RepID=V4HPV6_9EURY|nr:hypothetical protein [Candidatus Halobonum tyrrellensis]ESP89944.1 hypothetical protein K933_00237 [Candidatus Halobonum tyrrellensis G22]
MLTTEDTECGLRAALVAVCLAGLRDRNPGAVANGLITLACSYLPGFVERRYDVEFRPWQRLYVEGGMLAHAVGMLGPYDDVPWWDHLTHTLSATMLGGAVHVVARRRGRDPRPLVVGTVAVGGVVWELGEYAVHAASRRVGLDPLLVSYGPLDTALDVVFDLVGASLVVRFGDRLLGNLTGRDDSAGRPDRKE